MKTLRRHLSHASLLATPLEVVLAFAELWWMRERAGRRTNERTRQ